MPNSEAHTIFGNKVVKGDWTFWQDFDGIFLCKPGSNSCWAGFINDNEAEMFAKSLGGNWNVVRRGIFKTMSDIEAHSDTVVIFQRSLFGFTVVTSDYFENFVDSVLTSQINSSI